MTQWPGSKGVGSLPGRSSQTHERFGPTRSPSTSPQQLCDPQPQSEFEARRHREQQAKEGSLIPMKGASHCEGCLEAEPSRGPGALLWSPGAMTHSSMWIESNKEEEERVRPYSRVEAQQDSPERRRTRQPRRGSARRHGHQRSPAGCMAGSFHGTLLESPRGAGRGSGPDIHS